MGTDRNSADGSIGPPCDSGAGDRRGDPTGGTPQIPHFSHAYLWVSRCLIAYAHSQHPTRSECTRDTRSHFLSFAHSSPPRRRAPLGAQSPAMLSPLHLSAGHHGSCVCYGAGSAGVCVACVEHSLAHEALSCRRQVFVRDVASACASDARLAWELASARCWSGAAARLAAPLAAALARCEHEEELALTALTLALARADAEFRDAAVDALAAHVASSVAEVAPALFHSLARLSNSAPGAQPALSRNPAAIMDAACDALRGQPEGVAAAAAWLTCVCGADCQRAAALMHASIPALLPLLLAALTRLPRCDAVQRCGLGARPDTRLLRVPSVAHT